MGAGSLGLRFEVVSKSRWERVRLGGGEEFPFTAITNEGHVEACAFKWGGELKKSPRGMFEHGLMLSQVGSQEMALEENPRSTRVRPVLLLGEKPGEYVQNPSAAQRPPLLLGSMTFQLNRREFVLLEDRVSAFFRYLSGLRKLQTPRRRVQELFTVSW